MNSPTIAQRLAHHVQSGIHRIGQIEIIAGLHGHAYVLCHQDDQQLCLLENFGNLSIHHGPSDARDLSTYGNDSSYRFTKGKTNLIQGWAMTLSDVEELRTALDQFYPACLGLFLAEKAGTLMVENLRDKLNRQTGMYRFARSISDAGAQKLVEQVCGPAHECAKKILWKIDDATPLDDNEASRFNGIPSSLSEVHAIPLLCREACNHFVAECRKAAKAEHDAKNAAAS